MEAAEQTGRARLERWADNWLVLPKLLYFSLNMMVYSTYYFTSNYFEDVWDIPIHYYGYLSGLTTLGFLGSIFWTVLADRTGRHKSILLLSALGFAGSFSLLRLQCFKLVLWRKMLYVSLAYGLSNFFLSALYPLLDNRIFAILIQNPNFSTKLYGKQRLWGSIGQAVISMVNAYGIKTALAYDILFINLTWSTALFMLFVLAGIPSTRSQTGKTEEVAPLVARSDCAGDGKKKDLVPLDSAIGSAESVKEQCAGSVFRPVRTLLSNPQFLFFVALVLAAGYVRAILGHFLVYYFDKTVQQSPWVYALAMQMRLVSEILLFFLGRPLLNRFGAFWMMLVGLAAGTVRVAGYAVIPATVKWSYAAFGLEFLKGINNACVITAGVRIAHSLAPPGCEATAQGFFSGIQSNLANAVAGFVGGIILKWYESDRLALQWLFVHTALFSSLSCLAYGIQNYFWSFPDDHC